MKILYILRTKFGLMGTNASYFIPREVAQHHEVLVLEGPSYEAEADLIVVDQNGLNIHTVDETEFEKRFIELCNFIDRFKPDIIHVFYHHQALQLGQALRKKYGTNIKLLVDIRTPLLEDNWLQRARVQVKNIWMQKAFDMIATHSSYSVKTIFPLCILPVRELSYGVDSSAFKIRTKPWKKENIDLVYTGAIAKKRKIDQLLLGYSTLLQMPEAQQFKFTLHLYGAGNRIVEMKALVEHLKIKSHVAFHGAVSQSELSKNLHKNSIGIGYVPFGVYKQAPALKTLEYMCAGLSVFASDTQPTKDLISAGFQLTSYNNTETGFAKGILGICEKGWSNEKAQTNINLVKQFDWQNIVQGALLPMYQELVGM